MDKGAVMLAKNFKQGKYRYKIETVFDYKKQNKIEIEECDFSIEKIKDINNNLFLYKIIEQNNKYFTDKYYQNFFENYIFNELYLLVNLDFNVINILNKEMIAKKIEVVKNEIIKLKYLNEKINRNFLEIENFLEDDELLTFAIEKYKFYNLFINEVNSNEITDEILIFDILSEGIPLKIKKYKKDNKYIVFGELNYHRLSQMRFINKMKEEFDFHSNKIEIKYDNIIKLDYFNITENADRMIQILYENKRIFYKRETLEMIEN